MKLKDTNWIAVHFEDRTLLTSDRPLFVQHQWNNLLNLDVEPMEADGHYKVVTKP